MPTKKPTSKTKKSVAAKTVAPPKKKSSIKKLLLNTLGWLISAGLLYWIFVVKLPQQVSYAEVWATVQALSGTENFLLILGGLGTILAVGWTAATVLPGLKVLKGTQASVTGQMTSVALPPPLDMVIRFGMYKTYGFSVDKSAVAVVLAGIARYFAVVAVPLLGLLALIVAGQGNSKYVFWFVLVGAVFMAALWLLRFILQSDKSARKVGVLIQHIYNGLRRIMRKKPLNELADNIVDFEGRTKDVAIGNFWPIAISNVVWGLACYVVFLMAVRFCGIDSSVMSNAYLLFITGCMLLLNTLPITPGGIGVTEAILMSAMTFPNDTVQNAFVSALFVYRIYTWLLPMPVGIIAYLTWRYQIRGSRSLANKA